MISRPARPTPSADLCAVSIVSGACAVAAAALLLTACSGTSSPTPTRSSTTAVAAAPAIRHLSQVTCSSDAHHAWSFHATVTDRYDVRTTYTVTASLLQKKDGKVVGKKVMTTTLLPGASSTISAERFSTGDPKNVVCVPGVTQQRTG